MADVILPAVETDPDALANIGFDYLRTAWPDWKPVEGEGATTLILACARVITEGRDKASEVYPEIMRYHGRSIMRLAVRAAVPASAGATWRAVDDAGYTVQGGWEVLVRTSGDSGVAFRVVAPVTIPPGSTATAPGEVQLVAIDPGEAGNSFDSASSVVPIRTDAWVQGVELVGVSAGGRDAETPEEYLARYVETMEDMTETPIKPASFARILRRRVSAVGRTLAFEGYDPEEGTWGHARTVAVAATDIDGEPLSQSVLDDSLALLVSLREANWRSPVFSPTYTLIDVAFAGVCRPGYDPESVREEVVLALAGYLLPVGRGALPGELPDDPFVRYLEIAKVIGRVDGLLRIDSLGICAEGGTPSTNDIALDGPAALTRPGSNIDGTVTEG